MKSDLGFGAEEDLPKATETVESWTSKRLFDLAKDCMTEVLLVLASFWQQQTLAERISSLPSTLPFCQLFLWHALLLQLRSLRRISLVLLALL